jgi:hypothetical protein
MNKQEVIEDVVLTLQDMEDHLDYESEWTFTASIKDNKVTEYTISFNIKVLWQDWNQGLNLESID